MRILIAVHNLIVEKSHLMPWRTVCEVTRYMQEAGHEAFLMSLGEKNKDFQGNLIPAKTREIFKSGTAFTEEFKKELEKAKPVIIFWPITWRESYKKIKTIITFNIPVVFWFPGGVYSFPACIQAMKSIGLRNTLPYLMETVSSKKKQVKNFNKLGVMAILTMTQTTANSVLSAGWPKEKTFVIPPGKENSAPPESENTLPEDFKKWLGNKQFYLFMGPPSGIRGIFELLISFDIAADLDSSLRLVCLFRSDGTLDSQKVKSTIANCKHNGKIYTIWHSLKTEALNSFMAECHAVTMPFILVPSEIPLAIIEAMAWGKPIITTSPGGTSDFVKPFGLTPKLGNYNELANALIKLHQDTCLYKEKCRNAVDTYNNHPDWSSVAKQWIEVAKKVTMTK